MRPTARRPVDVSYDGNERGADSSFTHRRFKDASQERVADKDRQTWTMKRSTSCNTLSAVKYDDESFQVRSDAAMSPPCLNRTERSP